MEMLIGWVDNLHHNSSSIVSHIIEEYEFILWWKQLKKYKLYFVLFYEKIAWIITYEILMILTTHRY